MEAVVVTLVILGIMGSSFKEPAKAAPRPRQAAQRPAPLPVFHPIAWAPAPPPPATPTWRGGHIIPTRISS